MFVELPIMVHDLPERWRLPSIITLAMQLAQIGPLSFIILKCYFPKRISYTVTIYIILIVGILSCLLLYFFWNKTVIFKNEKRSIPLYVLTFSLGLLGNLGDIYALNFSKQNLYKHRRNKYSNFSRFYWKTL